MAFVTVTLRKHSATISWPTSMSSGIASGHLTVQTEDPHSETQEARDKAEHDLQTLARMLEAGGIMTAVSEAR